MAPTHTATMGGTHHGTSFKTALIAGAVAGQVSGLVMALAMMAVFTVFLGKGPFFPIQVIGSFVFGDAALRGFQFPALIAGMILHQLGPSLFWGLMMGFTVWLFRIEARGLLLWGLTLGILSQIVDVHVVLPVLFKFMYGRDIWAEQVPMFWSWAAHIAYGLTLSLYGLVEPLMPEKE